MFVSLSLNDYQYVCFLISVRLPICLFPDLSTNNNMFVSLSLNDYQYVCFLISVRLPICLFPYMSTINNMVVSGPLYY